MCPNSRILRYTYETYDLQWMFILYFTSIHMCMYRYTTSTMDGVRTPGADANVHSFVWFHSRRGLILGCLLQRVTPHVPSYVYCLLLHVFIRLFNLWAIWLKAHNAAFAHLSQ